MDFDITILVSGVIFIFVGFGYSVFEKRLPHASKKKLAKKKFPDSVFLNVFGFLKRDELDLCKIVCRKWKFLIQQNDARLSKRELILAKPDESDKLGLFDEKGFVFAYNSANLQDLLYHGFIRRYDLYLNDESILEAKTIFDLIGQSLEVDQCLITTDDELDLCYINSDVLKTLLTKYINAEKILFRNIKILLSESSLGEAENVLNIVTELEKYMRKKYKSENSLPKLEIGRSQIVATHFFDPKILADLLSQKIELDELDLMISKEDCFQLFADDNLLKMLLSTLIFNVVVIGWIDSASELDHLFGFLFKNEAKNYFNKNNISSKNELILQGFDGSFCICCVIIENILTDISCGNNCEATKYGKNWQVIEANGRVFKTMELSKKDGHILKITRLNPGRHFEFIVPKE